MIYTCRGCQREFEVRRALTAHKRHCLSKLADAAATTLAKRRCDREVLQAAKVHRQEGEEVALRARQDIRESLAEPESVVLAVRSLIIHVVVIFEVLSRTLAQGRHHPLHTIRQVCQIVAVTCPKDFATIFHLFHW
jgi:hypothetical protein